MNIELKNLSISRLKPGAFIAQLVIDGIIVGITRRTGPEQTTCYHHLDNRGKELIATADLYCKMHPREVPSPGNKEDGVEPSLT